MTVLDLQTLAPFFAERLLNTAVEGVVLAGLVWALFRFIGHSTSRSRFAVWFSALLAIVALPLFDGMGFTAPSVRYIYPRNLRPEITLSSSWASSLFAAWALIAGIMLLRLCFGLWRVRVIRRNSVEVDLASFDPAIASILLERRSLRRVRLCSSDAVAVPAAVGFFRPAIIFPARLLPQLSSEEIRVILLHELAHLRRWDDWTNLAQKIVKAVFFFHPAVWWIENRLTLEREMACDDIVLAQTSNPRAYASSLVSFAEKLQSARCLALAQALVSRVNHMSIRVAQILDVKRTSSNGTSRAALWMGAAILAFVICATPYAPRLVSFQNETTKLSANHEAQAGASNTSLKAIAGPIAAEPIPARGLSSQQHQGERAIPASLLVRTTPFPLHLKATSRRKPALIRTKATRRVLPPQETFVILQTTQYDATGSGVWTLCIWKVTGADLAASQLESAIIMSSI